MVEKKAPPKRPVGRPRTVNLDLAPGLTRSGNPPRVRVSAGKDRDRYEYRRAYEEKTGKRLPTDVVLDHIDPASKGDPNAKVRPMSRSANSKKDGGTRPNKGKAKK